MSLLDSIHGVIARRVLLNYRLDPAALRQILPAPFRPKLYRGAGIGGVCMIRFRQLRPRMTPAWLGLSSENAAHRIAVEWEQDGALREGVYIPQRNTNSWFNASFGGRVFPGIFTRSRFETHEDAESVRVRIVEADGREQLAFAGRPASGLPASSVFPTLTAAAEFFSLGATGYSATRAPGRYDGMELRCLRWTIEPLQVEEVRSRFYEDAGQFLRGAAEVDCALLMRDIDHEWHSRPDLFASADGARLSSRR
ncbi:DUF2071 domain-containing protein [Nannocystis punicea]|uniref:DUF2071 domain-containing protein n=1 Tax=Nannocystis punicea TaxID=2995304 RepID=A0ABY7H541_9BACT|nr:DUF2071 domain-containing protein [Nannocystis poenicansa]WAS94205.1 DUF2071 domain-containing protein [Nannocystis poenicansa]